MTIFEYVLVLLSVVLGLALAQLATGVGELLRSRRAVKWSLPYCLWLIVAFSNIIDLWTSGWLLRGSTAFAFSDLAILLGNALCIYLGALWLIPRHIGEEAIDTYDYLIRERRLFLGAFLGYILLGTANNLFLLTGHFEWAVVYLGLPMIAALGLAWWSPRREVQTAVPVVMLVMIAYYFAAYFPSIG